MFRVVRMMMGVKKIMPVVMDMRESAVFNTFTVMAVAMFIVLMVLKG